MTNSFVRAVLVSLTTLASCSSPTGPNAELTDARERWESRRITQYQYKFQRICFCLEETTRAVTIRVQGNVVTRAWYVANGSEVPAGDLHLYPTVEQLFAIIEDAIERKAARLDVEYDRANGYPTRIDIDYSSGTADDEIFIRTWELHQPPMTQAGVR